MSLSGPPLHRPRCPRRHRPHRNNRGTRPVLSYPSSMQRAYGHLLFAHPVVVGVVGRVSCLPVHASNPLGQLGEVILVVAHVTRTAMLAPRRRRRQENHETHRTTMRCAETPSCSC